MSGKMAIVSPVNLVHHLGLGTEASLYKDRDDMLSLLPRATLPGTETADDLLAPSILSSLPLHASDRAFDRARVLIELLVRTRDPHMARQLALRRNLPLNGTTRTHLLPFLHQAETCQWLRHLAEAGVDTDAIERWVRALGMNCVSH